MMSQTELVKGFEESFPVADDDFGMYASFLKETNLYITPNEEDGVPELTLTIKNSAGIKKVTIGEDGIEVLKKVLEDM